MTVLRAMSLWWNASWRAPRLRLLALLTAGMFLQLALWRGVFAVWFGATAKPAPLEDLVQACGLGLRFDLRLTLFSLVPVALALALPHWLTPVAHRGTRLLCTLWLGLVSTAIALVALIDLGHFDYLGTRLNASVLRFTEDAHIASTMVWESYPVVWGLLGLIVYGTTFGVLAHWLQGRATRWVAPTYTWTMPGTIAAGALVILVSAFGMYGKLSLYPLRWSQAFSCDNAYVVGLGLNPVLFFVDTLKVRQANFDVKQVEAAYPLMAQRLRLPNTNVPPGGPDFARHVPATAPAGRPPCNVIVVLLETQANYFMGAAGNPLDPTPHLDGILRESVSCTRAYAAAYGTARSVWGLFTGIPDVSLWRTASRNPLIANQHSLATAFAGYEHFYFLGGSANWANIRGLMQSSQPGLRIFEEGDYPGEQVIDVWGVSDLAMLRRANGVLASRDPQTPFFAFLQTAGNHRPYTIPDNNAGFVMKQRPEADLTAAGFQSNDQFNAVRLIDHFIGLWKAEFLRSAYAQNTIVVLFGDHGTSGPRSPAMGGDFEMGLTHLRVPIAIWAPGLGLAPRQIAAPVSLVDILPTVAALAGVEHVNTTLGQNMLDPEADPERGIFMVVDEDRPRIGYLGQRFFYAIDADGSRPKLHDRESADVAADTLAANPIIAERMHRQLMACYQTAQFMLEHNAPRPHTLPPLTESSVPASAVGHASADRP